ncbi:gamma-glutamyl-gamma-aminobutyrate hydrolase family protein [Pseudoduganella ginsengisoli]|uniref:gamma-glutamyl-gamma-aminobutyrate hydrolase n=1 Tax=Pseudoduganella ginsengisoli TaxID=1462440 RepID=A0A6L6PVZ6_9BURK|nr:gamma-glutamyl-gamma-aminobutyrate hydrolase family protein [Pseudoduganella ginsengisoli]MTW01188.1 gamma-glutamyl-gamma-aminobutyrate hydrolase family protein [Pseudoduganella ginsengisoli]
MRRPIVIVPACKRSKGDHPTHTVQTKYIDAVVQGAGCMPLIVPALGGQTDIDAVLSVADDVMLTGATSNVDAALYGQAVHDPSLPLDPARDATTLPLLRAAIERGIPLFGICRGFQEINVALGGTLHQAVQEVPGMMDHRDRPGDPLDVQYGPAHRVRLAEGGLLAGLLDARDITVNSLHGQGVALLAPGLTVEAVADDGLVEAYTVDGAAFALAVQWHPEWRVTGDAVSMKLFHAFGLACHSYQERIP